MNLFENHWGNSPRQYGFWEDFNAGTLTGDLWTILEADTGSAVNEIDAAGGILELTTTTTDNNEAYISTTKEQFKIVNHKPCEMYARYGFAEGSTDAINVLFGFMDAAGANSIVDSGAGPDASYSGAVFFTQEGETLWTVQTSLATTQNNTQLTAVNALDKLAKTANTGAKTTFGELWILIEPINSTKANATFSLKAAGGKKTTVFVQEFTYTSATEMDIVAGLKSGSTVSEILWLDAIAARQIR